MVHNPAADAGWVKSTDPNSGRSFFANHLTRKTQWDPPEGWVDEDAAPPSLPPPPPLPPKPQEEEWEEMTDPSSGKSFYVNHATQETTWTRPAAMDAPNNSTTPAADNSYTGMSMDYGYSAPERPRSNSFASTNSANSSQWGGVPVAPPSSSASSVSSLGGRSAAMSRVLNQHSHSSSSMYGSGTKPNHVQPERSAFAESAYFQPTPTMSSKSEDYSDTLPPQEFRVKKVLDSLRTNCPHCNAVFTMSKRRHHCRLCGDVFCHECSNHKATLPLEGPEFEKPVRICDFCQEDVEKGNFFSMRRYLTPLTLYENNGEDTHNENELGVATAKNVSAALSSLTTDLNGLLESGGVGDGDGDSKQLTIPTDVLVAAICKHLALEETSDRAVHCIASLLALGSILAKPEYAHAVHLFGGTSAMDALLKVLERSSQDRKTLFVQEQAARAIFYLTESSVMSSLERAAATAYSDESITTDVVGGMDSLDLSRSLRNMLDHGGGSTNPNLQRWATSTIRNMVQEDQRRAVMANNEIASLVAAGQDIGFGSESYQSFLPEMVSTGGIMILCSLIGCDDSDTRAHAMSALGATLTATRAMDGSLGALFEMTGGQAGSKQETDGNIVRAIVNGGGCSVNLSQLLLSADNQVAGMGCNFAASLVMPLLKDPRGTATLPSSYDCTSDDSSLGACREAALAMASGSCLPALLGLLRDKELGGRMNRPLELKQKAIETLAAVIMSIGEMGKAHPGMTLDAIQNISEEGVIPIIVAMLESSANQSLSHRETPGSRIRESAGIILSAMTLCSGDALDELQACQAVTTMLSSISDPSMTMTSTMRGDGAPRCLGMVHTTAALLNDSWRRRDVVSKSDLLDKLIEVIDAGAVSVLSRILFTKLDWESQDKAVGAMKARDAACRMLCAIFGIANMDNDDVNGNDGNGFGQQRLYEIVDADAYSRNPPRNVMTAALGTLQKASNIAKNAMLGAIHDCGPHYHAAVMDLVEAALLAVASMCGSSMLPGTQSGDFTSKAAKSNEPQEFKIRRQEVCSVACDVLVHVKEKRGQYQNQQQGALLPTMMVGAFGEGCVTAALRLALAIAQNGTMEHHAKLSMTGILVPISDSLRSALSQGDLFKFSAALALVRFCGPHVAAGEGSGLTSVREAIRVATGVLKAPFDPHQALETYQKQEAIKAECVSALEALSSNTSLWSSISKDALPAIVSYLHSSTELGVEHGRETRCAALRAIARIVKLSSHAVAAARAGVAEPLAKLVAQGTQGDGLSDKKDEMPLLALEILHVMTTNDEARRSARLLDSGVITAVCHALGNAATDKPKKPTDSRADVTFWGLDILHKFLSDADRSAPNFQLAIQAPTASSMVAIAVSQPNFVRALCATLLLKTGMKFPDNDGGETDFFQIPLGFGPPLVRVQEKCAGYDSTHYAAVALLFRLTVYSCALDSSACDAFWRILLCQTGTKTSELDDNRRLGATFCSQFLRMLLEKEKGPFVPKDAMQRKDFEKISCPIVRYRLMDSLKANLSKESRDPYILSMIVGFEVPRTCLTLWQDPTLAELSFSIIKMIASSNEDDMLHIFVESKSTILSLFDMLSVDSSDSSTSEAKEIRRTVANILGNLAENGLLTDAVEKFGVRSGAVAALAAACLADEEDMTDDTDDVTATEATLSSRCMHCLVDLCTVEDKQGVRSIKLAADEAKAIAQRLGKKICSMAITRFMERSKLEQYDVEHEEDVTEAPDVRMLCAIAQHTAALQIIASVGGLQALSLVASEGDFTAISALKKICKDDPSTLVDVDGHISLMKLIVDSEHFDNEDIRQKTDAAAFDLLADLCLTSKGRRAVSLAGQCSTCMERAIDMIADLVEHADPVSAPAAVEDDSSTGEEEQSIEATNDDADDGEEEEEETNSVQIAPQKKVVELPKLKELKRSVDAEESALLFLSSVARVDVCRSQILENEKFAQAALVLSTSPGSKLHAQTTSFLVFLAPYTSNADDQILSSDRLANTFIAALKLSLPNKVVASMAEGISTFFDLLSPENQSGIVEALTPLWIKIVRKFTVARNTGTADDRADGADMAYSISALLLRSHPLSHLRPTVTSKEVLTAFVHSVQWQSDTLKSSLSEDDQIAWSAAIDNALAILAMTLCNGEADPKRTASLMKTPLMVARPGKAPRKACDFPTALKRVVQSKKSPSSVMSSKRILAYTSP